MIFQTTRGTVFIVFALLLVRFAVQADPPSSAKRVAAKAEPTSTPTATSGPTLGRPGPWGSVQWTSSYLEAPKEILDDLRRPDANPRWGFPGETEAEVQALLAKAGVSSEVQRRILAPERMMTQQGALYIYPKPEDIEALSPQARQVIYAELAKSPVNELHHNPVIIPGSLEDWLRDTGLRPQLQDIIRKMSYRYGNALAFSDLRVLFDYAVSDEELDHIFKTLTRTRTLLGELKVSPGSDATQLLAYWTAGDPKSEVGPLLKAALERAGGASLDITHLLPPLGRRRLYTFPTGDLIARGRYPDGHWTSFNFFTSSPQNPSLELRPDDNTPLEDYDLVKDSKYGLGDLICLLNAKGEIVHTCVYVADDVVFTKNGGGSVSPWVLWPLQEVKDYFSHEASGETKVYRRKRDAVGPAQPPP